MESIDYIIPTWNSAATLELTIKSIERFGHPNQIIIVDRDSSDGTLDIARSHGCRIIRSIKPLGGARLEGARNAETELVGFVDSEDSQNYTL
ncbi:MAG: glycosyltransferase [Methanothrix sp.]|uniref:glycosyltransferase family 2 protein n=1 Tax=Methanothrix sp. TaxID=90426 RepID=UPI0025EEA414|nr:glycosyltransferase [Methanothrix sp.]MCQ8903116.1 glycosyltransferase [Methanothrix sp.]